MRELRRRGQIPGEAGQKSKGEEGRKWMGEAGRMAMEVEGGK